MLRWRGMWMGASRGSCLYPWGNISCICHGPSLHSWISHLSLSSLSAPLCHLPWRSRSLSLRNRESCMRLSSPRALCALYGGKLSSHRSSGAWCEKPLHYLPEPILRMGVIKAFLSRFHGGEWAKYKYSRILIVKSWEWMDKQFFHVLYSLSSHILLQVLQKSWNWICEVV